MSNAHTVNTPTFHGTVRHELLRCRSRRWSLRDKRFGEVDGSCERSVIQNVEEGGRRLLIVAGGLGLTDAVHEQPDRAASSRQVLFQGLTISLSPAVTSVVSGSAAVITDAIKSRVAHRTTIITDRLNSTSRSTTVVGARDYCHGSDSVSAMNNAPYDRQPQRAFSAI